ncbi:TRAP transporter large permease subunit [Desulfobotulus sp. H1]|uniref:TRAP transporter large permease subunit n=1 Tax=Desulfobotulus pelophilus TaxID=2823377 RepID=A0ABT3N687_9BACT|nr:TRAP transporter large permease subunit [Desulfobotulus pelophilus]MCW7752973.1 TRAP transporter large permease subunit [Desulfobotulus pelophilus]
MEAARTKQSPLHWINENFESIFMVTGLLAIIFFITWQVFYRYILVSFIERAGGSVWAEELSRYIFIWISYLALSFSIRKRSSIRVDIIYDKLSPRFQGISWIIVEVLFLCLTLTIAWFGYGKIQNLLQFPQSTPAMRIPFLVPYLILPIGFGLMSLRLLQSLSRQFRTCGVQDSVTGLALTMAIISPCFIFGYIEPIPVLFGYFILLCILGVPIAISLGLSTLATIICADTLPVGYMAQITFTSIDSFPIMAIPFFIAAGVFMGAGGLSERLLALADEIVGGLYGGMGLTCIVTCMFFGAISGSGPATVAAIGALIIPAMKERGYDIHFSAALIAAAGCVGVMIPPSNPFVVYGVSAQVSIGDLFISGIVPGLLTGLVLMVYCYLYSRKKGWRGSTKQRTPATFARAAWDAKWALMVPVIVLGGIYGGIMTPTEAAAVAAFYGLFIGVCVYREMSAKGVVVACREACETSAMIIVLIAMATLFGNIMTIEDVPGSIARWLLDLTSNKHIILLLVIILLLIVGTFMEALAAIVILTPILLPIVTSVGVSPLHFGVIMVLNLAIGFITPPVGVNLFVASGIAKVKLEKVSVAVLPMLVCMLFILLLCTFIPEIPLFLVGSR